MGDRGAQRLVKNPLIHVSFLYVGPVASRHLLQSVFFFFFHADKGIRIFLFIQLLLSFILLSNRLFIKLNV